jgi:hypothetical protein
MHNNCCKCPKMVQIEPSFNLNYEFSIYEQIRHLPMILNKPIKLFLIDYNFLCKMTPFNN